MVVPYMPMSSGADIYSYQWFKDLDEAQKEYDTNQALQKVMGTGTNALNSAIQAQIAAANKEAEIKANAAKEALAWQKEQYAKNEANITGAVETARSDVNPWRVAGEDALGRLTTMINAGPGEYTQSPGYQARLDEGQKAIERSAAAKGGALSGAAVKAATRFGQDYAAQDYDNFLRRYYQSLTPFQQMSGVGANAAQAQGNYSVAGANSLANAGSNAIRDMTSTNIYSGEATAGGVMNASNILAAYQQALAEQNKMLSAWKTGNTTSNTGYYA